MPADLDALKSFLRARDPGEPARDAAEAFNRPIKASRPNRAALEPMADLLADLNLVTKEQARNVLEVDAPRGERVTVADVADARALLAREQVIADALSAGATAWNAFVAACDAARNDAAADVPGLGEYVGGGK